MCWPKLTRKIGLDNIQNYYVVDIQPTTWEQDGYAPREGK